MPSDRSKVEIYYSIMSSVTAQNKFLVGTFFCPAVINIIFLFKKENQKVILMCEFLY